jgi:hypothetical protein
MDHARVLTVSTPDALRAEATGAIVELLARPKRRALELLKAQPNVAEVEAFGERLHATLPDVAASQAGPWSERLAAALRAAGLEVEQARAVPPSLEDIFITRIRARETAAAEAR